MIYGKASVQQTYNAHKLLKDQYVMQTPYYEHLESTPAGRDVGHDMTGMGIHASVHTH